MKKLNTEFLDTLLYEGRNEKNPVKNDGKHFTVRDYLKYLVDLPIEKITVTLSKQLDKIYDALCTDAPELEDAEFEVMKDRIDKAGIKSKQVFDVVQKVFE
ncbi:MAG: hypothetical protein SFW66_08945 [Gammaproteobacteria bacterium]|nr:hypothetical protein [Gammaproteobacteria bacterium]